MNPSERKLVMKRVKVVREQYSLGDDSDAALMLTVLANTPTKIAILATELLQELEPDAGWHWDGRMATMDIEEKAK